MPQQSVNPARWHVAQAQDCLLRGCSLLQVPSEKVRASKRAKGDKVVKLTAKAQ